MGNNCPLHCAQPFGAKPNDMILISLRNGSAMYFSLPGRNFREQSSKVVGVEVKERTSTKRSEVTFTEGCVAGWSVLTLGSNFTDARLQKRQLSLIELAVLTGFRKGS